MSKLKKANKFSEDNVSNTIVSKYGDIVKSGTEILENINKLEVISVSPALDIALGGGLREGSVVVMTGDPKSGKSTTALHFAVKCQKKDKRVIYINTEGRLAKQNFEGIKDLDADKILIIESTNDRVLTAEDFLNIIEYYINNDPGCLIIADSLSNMVPSQELEGEVRTGVRNALPRLLSMFFKRISGTLMKNRVILICVTHNIANTGGSPYAPQKMADCGNMLQYQAGTNMVITHRGKWQVPKDTGPHVGQIANWSIKTSNAGGRPNSTAESWIRYGIGVDETQEIIQIACEFRLIKSAGAWYTIQCAVDEPEHQTIKSILEQNSVDKSVTENVEKFFKFQGINNVLEFLESNPSVASFIYEKIKELH
jgi:recombination protein RecA